MEARLSAERLLYLSDSGEGKYPESLLSEESRAMVSWFLRPRWNLEKGKERWGG